MAENIDFSRLTGAYAPAKFEFVPGINVIFGFYLLLVQGSVGPNQYGPDPLMH